MKDNCLIQKDNKNVIRRKEILGRDADIGIGAQTTAGRNDDARKLFVLRVCVTKLIFFTERIGLKEYTK